MHIWLIGLYELPLLKQLGSVYFVVPLIISLVLTTRFSTLSFGNLPSTWSISMLAASSPIKNPRCSTVVSIGSHAIARCPFVKPQMEISSGI